MAAQYETPIHYQASPNGEWEDIDNTLVETKEGFVPKASEQKIILPKDAFDSQGVQIKDEKYPISWKYDVPDNSKNEVPEPSTKVVTEDNAPADSQDPNSNVDAQEPSTEVLGNDDSITESSILSSEVEVPENETKTITEDNKPTNPQNMRSSKIEIQESKAEELEEDEKFTELQNLSGKAIYKNIENLVNLEYTVTPYGLKEDIVLAAKSAANEYFITYNIGKLTAKSADEQTVLLLDESGETIYTISAPYMFDSKDEVSFAVSLGITDSDDTTLRIKISADRDWLDDSERAYPVKIDPILKVGTANNSTSSYTIFSSTTAPTFNRNHSISGIRVGTYVADGEFQTVRSVIKLNSLPTLGVGDVIVNATLNLKTLSLFNNPRMQIKAHQITASSADSWNGTTFDSKILDYAYESSASAEKDPVFDITKTVKEWYSNSSSNKGILLDSDHEGLSVSKHVFYYDSSYSTASYRPVFTLVYRSYKGIEPKLTYHTYPVGANGTGSIGDYLGNLVLRQNVITSTGNRMPVNISLTYNSLLYNKVFGNGSPAGYGWQFSFNQYIELASTDLQNQGYKYIYTDEDGTEHYYKQKTGSTTEWLDEDNDELVLKLNGSYLYLSDGSIEKKFELPAVGGGKLLLETDIADPNVLSANKSKITYTYNGSGNLTSISDGVGRQYTLAYSTNSSTGQVRVSSITDMAASKTVTFLYWGGANGNDFDRLSYICYPDGTSSPIGYYSDHRIGSFYAPDSTYFGVSYNSSGKVSQVSEYDNGGSLGNYLNISYGSNNTTTYTDR